jgi:alanine racemase
MDARPGMDGEGWLRLEVDTAALRHNAQQLRSLVRPPARLLLVVKADGYGHGLELAARAFLDGGADVLGVHAMEEALRLRGVGIRAPILVLGPLDEREVVGAAAVGCDITVGSLEGVAAVTAAAGGGLAIRVHLKVETGVNRQGVREEDFATAVGALTAAPGVRLVGLSSHFADIEDTTDHGFALRQQARFDAFARRLADLGHDDVCRHMSCSAATVLWEASHRDLARVGVAAYGVWPSRETLVAARLAGRHDLDLRPAMTWKVRLSQVKAVPAGETVGYGRTWLAPTDSRIAVLPVGYADGYPRGLSSRAHVLVRGRRAPVRGRICMNLCMVDVTHVPGAEAGDDAVLLGRQGEDAITYEQMAEWLGTIVYEVLTLPRSTWRRVEVNGA